MNDYPYRKGANAIVIDKNNQFLLIQKVRYGNNQWDFPGGGMDEEENCETAVLRELQEELHSVDFKIIKKARTKYNSNGLKRTKNLASKNTAKGIEVKSNNNSLLNSQGTKTI